MSLLVNYTLKSDDYFDAQVSAMKLLVDGLKTEGIGGLNYSGFSTDDHRRFLGLLEFPDDATKQQFLTSTAFQTIVKLWVQFCKIHLRRRRSS